MLLFDTNTETINWLVLVTCIQIRYFHDDDATVIHSQKNLSRKSRKTIFVGRTSLSILPCMVLMGQLYAKV